MAYTRIHPIKKTLKKALDYIVDDNKTDHQLLISSYKCNAIDASDDFLKVRELHQTRGDNLARHLIQSFAPGEVDMNTAHQIGLELCKDILQNDYQYVLSTHVDKGHIHNHIIFNNVNMNTGRCYQSNKKSYRKTRSISDRLCKEKGLSVIDEDYQKFQEQYKKKGKSWYEYSQYKKGLSWKDKLSNEIDKNIVKANTWEDFLDLMSKKYEIKRGKHIAFKLKNSKQDRFTRAKTIGDSYTEDAIKNRISGEFSTLKSNHSNTDKSKEKKVNNIIRVDSSKGKGLEIWAKRENLKTAAASRNALLKMGLNTSEKINNFLSEKNKKLISLNEMSDQLKEYRLELGESMEALHAVHTFRQYYDYSKNHPDDKMFLNEYSLELSKYNKGINHLKKTYKTGMPKEKEILNELDNLDRKLDEIQKSIASNRDKMKYVQDLQNNMKEYVKIETNKIKDRDMEL